MKLLIAVLTALGIVACSSSQAATTTPAGYDHAHKACQIVQLAEARGDTVMPSTLNPEGAEFATDATSAGHFNPEYRPLDALVREDGPKHGGVIPVPDAVTVCVRLGLLP